MTGHSKRNTLRENFRVSAHCDAVFEGSCYIVEVERLTWTEARARCVQLGGHLASIESHAENQIVFGLAEGTRDSNV